MKKEITSSIHESIRLKELLLNDEEGIAFIQDVSNAIISSIKSRGKLMICGNGGSAADAQHFAAELVGRFVTDRKALPALALTTDTSILTAVANDYCYDNVFLRQIEAFCNSNDVVVGISTSGNSNNVVKAIKLANDLGATTVALLGQQGGVLRDMVKYAYIVPSNESARIQEVHIMIEHIICEIVESEMFPL